MKRRGAAVVAVAAWANGAGAQPPPLIQPVYEIVSYAPTGATVTCREGAARVVSAPPPPSRLDLGRGPTIPAIADREPSKAVTVIGQRVPPSTGYSVTFNINADGRTQSIARATPPRDPYDTGDQLQQAVVAAWRFAPGQAYTGCTYAPTIRRTPLDQASAADALRLLSESSPGPAAQAVRSRAAGPDSDCLTSRPAPLLAAFPAFKTLPATPGRRNWVALGYDLDASGRPQRARVLQSTGSAPLDAAALRALNQSRWEPGARRGCLHWYWHRGGDLPAPARPDLSAFVRPGDDCPNTEDRSGRVKLVNGALHYPQAFRERGILGWAIVRFDVATWGQVGPPEVVAAEPAAAFGQSAQNLIRTARADPGPGWRGCLQHVVFQLADEDEPLPPTGELRVR